MGNVEPIGTRTHGNIESNGDRDYFKIDTVAGHSYRIDVKGSETSAFGGTLGDPEVELLDQQAAEKPGVARQRRENGLK